MQGIVGSFNEHWTMSQALAAAQAKRADDWERLGWGLYWLVNSMPNFSKTRRTVVPLATLNPLLKRSRRARSKSPDAAFDALWAIAEEER